MTTGALNCLLRLMVRGGGPKGFSESSMRAILEKYNKYADNMLVGFGLGLGHTEICCPSDKREVRTASRLKQ